MRDVIALIFRALQSEFEAVQIYKEVANSSRELGKEELASNFDEIARDEMVHIGNLEELLKIHEKEQYDEFIKHLHQGFQEVEKEDKLPETSSKKVLRQKDFLSLREVLPKTALYSYLEDSRYKRLVIEKSSLENPTILLQKLQEYRNKHNLNVSIEYKKDTIECYEIPISNSCI